MPALDILAIGEPMVEFNRTDPKEPLYRSGVGGDVSNCAIAAARLGARTGVFTHLGTDFFADAILALWAEEGVEAAAVRRRADAPTGAYVINHDARGHHFAYLRKGSAASLIGPADLPQARIADARLLHASGISAAISMSACDAMFEAFALARAAGVAIAYDTNHRPALWPTARARAVTREALSQATIALPSLEDASVLLGTDDPDRCADAVLSLGPEVVALTMGAAGCLIATSDARRRIAPPAVEAIDASGAGDCFDGAFLTRFLETGDPFEAGAFATTAAALATTGFGAVAPLPRRNAVDAARAA